jgi:pimeloyl-ACP methyl ester carboxylesterase
VLDGVPWDPASARGLEHVDRQVRAEGLLAGRAAWLAHPLFATARARPDLAARLEIMVAGYPGQHWLAQDPHRESGPVPMDALEAVTAPALVVAGEHDVPGFREMSAVLARRLPGAAAHVMAGAGHMVNLEQPTAANDLLTGFLDGLLLRTTDPTNQRRSQ